jgi:hypothetical protein
MAYDFRAWLNTKPADEGYNYMDNTGQCAIGQWMAYRGETWNLGRYSDHVKELFPDGISPLVRSHTFGELRDQLVEA